MLPPYYLGNGAGDPTAPVWAPSPLTAYVYKHVLSYVGGLPPTLVPPAVRGLTELFLVVENLAQVRQTACFYKCTLEESI